MSTERKKEIKSGIIMIIVVAGIIATLWFISVSISKGSSNVSNKGITWNIDFIDEDGEYAVVVFGNDPNKDCYFSVYNDKNQLLLFTNGCPVSTSTAHSSFYLEKDKNYTIKTSSDEIYQIVICKADNKDTIHIWTPDKVYSKDNIDSNSFENYYSKELKKQTDKISDFIKNNGKSVFGQN